VSGRIDPLGDIEIIETELMLADLETVQKSLDKAERNAKSNEKAAVMRRDVLRKVAAELEQGRPVRGIALDEAARGELRELHLITAKPVMYVANVGESELAGNRLAERVVTYAAETGAEAVVISARIEAELAQLDAGEKAEFLAELGLDEPGLDRVIRCAYRLLGLKTFFTAGPKEVRAWTVRKQAAAPEAAGVIHTDFQRGFIRAEVVAYESFVARGGEQGARETGELRSEGKTYVVEEGDVIHFRFNV
jgi:ribosome-binding ATPase